MDCAVVLSFPWGARNVQHSSLRNIRTLHFLQIILVSPIYGLGIAIRTSPYMLVFMIAFAWAQGVEVPEEIRSDLADLVNLLPRRRDVTADSVLWPVILTVVLYTFMLLVSRMNRGAAQQFDLADRRDYLSLIVPRFKRFRVSIQNWMFTSVIAGIALALTDGWPLGARLAEPLILPDQPERLNRTAPLVLTIGAIGAFYFPLFGAAGIRSAIRLSKPPMWATGGLILVLVAFPFLVLSFKIMNLLIEMAPVLLEPLRLPLIPLTRGMYLALMFMLYWSMMSAAAARVCRRKLVREIARKTNQDVSLKQVEHLLPDLLRDLRRGPRDI